MSIKVVITQNPYLPLEGPKPRFGVSTGDEGEIRVALSASLPVVVGPALQNHLKPLVGSLVDPGTVNLIWSLTEDFFSSQIMAGNLRWDSVCNIWRWFGSYEVLQNV